MNAAVTPDGKLLLGGKERKAGDVLLGLLRKDGLLENSEEWIFLRRVGRAFMVRLCRSRERETEAALAAALPDERELAELLFDRPPFDGGEFLNTEMLRGWCRELACEIGKSCRESNQSLSSWIAGVDPLWDHVGRVAFHLAPNPADVDGHRPFLFLATFIYRLGESGEPKHLPLGSALKNFADDRETLRSVLAPIRQAAEKLPFLAAMTDDGRIYQASPLSPREGYEFLQGMEVFDALGIEVRFARLWEKKRPPRLEVKLSLDAGPKTSHLASWALLRFSASAVIDGRELSEEELDALAASEGGGLIRIKGEWVEADPGRAAELLRLWRSRGNAMKLTLAQGLRLMAGLPAAGVPAFDRAEAVGHLAEVLATRNLPPAHPLPEELSRQLRPYQRNGVIFLRKLTDLGMGALLADDMGLGKTVQILIYLETLRREGELEGVPALVVSPASLLRNWLAESERFTPDLRFKILHAGELSEDEIVSFRDDPAGFLKRFDVVIVTYALISRGTLPGGVEFPVLIADEAQAIKNPASRQSRALRAIAARRRIALTGTPVENRLSDFWSIFDFLNPGLLGTWEEFRTAIEALEGHYAPLRKLTGPYILRRLKTDRAIAADLPDKTEFCAYVRLSALQAALYRATVEEMRVELEAESESEFGSSRTGTRSPDAESGENSRRRGVVFKYLTRFKQICNHPAQFTGKPDWNPELSGKFQMLAELLYPIVAKHEKVLIFTQFREMIEPLHEYVSHIFGRPGLVLHGGVPVGVRAGLVERFQSRSGEPFFILSLKAAGTGLNLTAANHVIHFDRWWNPAVENQATDRAYRIGQHRNVLVRKMVCLGTVEERIDRMIREKRHLMEELTVAAGTAEAEICRMNNAELLQFVQLDWREMNALRG